MRTVRRHSSWALLVLGCLALSACGSESPGAAPSSAPVVTVTSPVAPPPVTVTATPTPTEPAPVATSAPVATPTPSAEPVTFVMPPLVGQNLQLAQDILQKQGSYVMDQTDALGLNRIQVNDSNWTVCAQAPKAGATVDVSAMVTLSSVKLTEACP